MCYVSDRKEKYMHSNIHHAALSVQDFDWYVDFFSNVVGMTVERTRGEKPHRIVWFSQGIQINEVSDDLRQSHPAACDHISIGVDIDPVEAAGIAKAHGCHTAEGKGAHWFALPNDVLIELKPLP